jgi:hypothetical protein
MSLLLSLLLSKALRERERLAANVALGSGDWPLWHRAINLSMEKRRGMAFMTCEKGGVVPVPST